MSSSYLEKPKSQKQELGATMMEYALLVALIAVAAIIGVSFFGNRLSDETSDISREFDEAVNP